MKNLKEIVLFWEMLLGLLWDEKIYNFENIGEELILKVSHKVRAIEC